MPLDVLIVWFSLSWAGMYCYIVYIDGDISSINKVTEYGVHHHLRGSQWVGEAEEHYCWFVEPFVGNECCFPSVFLFDEDFIIFPLDIETYEEGAASELVD